VSRKRTPWRPTTIKRFVKALSTSASTAIVETDAGQAYLKPMGPHEGPHILACEWVGTRLAEWFGLSTFEFAIIGVTDVDEIRLHRGGFAQSGPAFVTRAESGEPWGGSEAQLRKLVNPRDISQLVVFDTWTLNCDRHSWPAGDALGNARQNRNNVFLSEDAPAGQLRLKAMDHTHCFTCGHPLSPRLARIDNVRDVRLFGVFPEFREFLDRKQVRKAVKRLREMDRAQVVALTEGIPKEWEVTGPTLRALNGFVVDRAAFVGETIEERIWPQRELRF
jgi:hypothetical protein